MDPYEQAMMFQRQMEARTLWSKPDKVGRKPRIQKNVPMVFPKTEIVRAIPSVQPVISQVQHEIADVSIPEFQERQIKRNIGNAANVAILSIYQHFQNQFLQTIATPMKMVHETIFRVGYVKNSKVLVFFNVEFVFYLVKVLGADVNTIFFVDDSIDNDESSGKIRSIKAGMLAELLNMPAANIVLHLDLEKLNMKFDYVVGNPPYDGKAALHQQFFVKAFDLLNESGKIAFIQPATPYLNKKDCRKKQAEQQMIGICKEHTISVKFYDGVVAFPAAVIKTAVAITVASKNKTNSLIDVEYMNGTKITSPFSGINLLQISGTIFDSIRDKYQKMCAVNGSFQNVVWTPSASKAYLAKIRGNDISNKDFFTLVPSINNNGRMIESHNCGSHEFGIPIGTPDDIDNFYNYSQSFFARFALALLKMNVQNSTGELALIPLVDFSRTYTEDELFDMAGFTAEERDIILNTLPDYHKRLK